MDPLIGKILFWANCQVREAHGNAALWTTSLDIECCIFRALGDIPLFSEDGVK